jgi:hypothetical protein
MQSGFDPPPPPGGNPPRDPSAPSFAEQPTEFQPAIEQPAQQPSVQQPQQQPPYPLPQAPPGYPQNYPQQNSYPQDPYRQQPWAQQQFIQPAPGYVQPMGGYGGYGYAAPTDGKATASLVLGIVSIFCFGFLSGIPAIIFGFLARRDIARSGGALSGAGMALGGIIIGSLGTLMSVVSAVMFAVGMIGAAHAVSGIPTGYPTSPFVIPTPPPTPTATEAPATTTLHGNIKVVTLDTGAPLQSQLIDLRATEVASGRTVIVETTSTKCAPCQEIESNVDDPLVQRALDNVTLVMVDIDEFGAELSSLKMATNALPFFYKIDSTARATDAISGDEWDANTPVNEAPVLGAFAKGTLKKRRHPSSVGTAL